MTETDISSIKGKKYKICFFSLYAFPYLSDRDVGSSGGAEHQQALLARELARRGHQVSFIVKDFGQREIMDSDGIRIYKFSLPESRKMLFLSRIIRFFTRIQYFWNILSKPGADIYYQRCAGTVTGSLSLYCLIRRKKFIYSIASRSDVDGTVIHDSYFSGCPRLLRIIPKASFVLGLLCAGCVVAQNTEQQILLRKNYRKKSVLIKSLYRKPEHSHRSDHPTEIIWISSIQKMKQPELFLELARLLPDTRFRMIGGASVDREYYEQIKNEAEKIPNLAFTGFVPPGDVQKYYENAMVIINTSLYEGFPNTFLEAWSNAIPVVSLNVDPDEIICDKNLGIHSKNPDQLLLDVKKLVRDRPLRETLGMNGKNYLEDEHSAESVVSHYEKVFDRLMSSPE